MQIPEPIVEGPVKISWKQSVTDPLKAVSTFEVDFGKTDFNPVQAAAIERAIVTILRGTLKVSLSRHK